MQETETVTKFFVYVCRSESRSITLGILYGYKMIPQVIALICAFSIRKIKIKGLDDAKYIAFSIYITSLVTAIIIVITYTLDDYINVYAAIFLCWFLHWDYSYLGLSHDTASEFLSLFPWGLGLDTAIHLSIARVYFAEFTRMMSYYNKISYSKEPEMVLIYFFPYTSMPKQLLHPVLG